MSNKRSDKNIVRVFFRLMKSTKAYRKILAIAIFGVFIKALSEGALLKYVVPMMTDKGLIEKEFEFLQTMPWLILGIFLAFGIGDLIGKFATGYVARSTVRDHRNKLLTHLLRLPTSYYKDRTSGELISKINYDAEQVAVAL